MAQIGPYDGKNLFPAGEKETEMAAKPPSLSKKTCLYVLEIFSANVFTH
jgi:hypothetical protein